MLEIHGSKAPERIGEGGYFAFWYLTDDNNPNLGREDEYFEKTFCAECPLEKKCSRTYTKYERAYAFISFLAWIRNDAQRLLDSAACRKLAAGSIEL